MSLRSKLLAFVGLVIILIGAYLYAPQLLLRGSLPVTGPSFPSGAYLEVSESGNSSNAVRFYEGEDGLPLTISTDSPSSVTLTLTESVDFLDSVECQPSLSSLLTGSDLSGFSTNGGTPGTGTCTFSLAHGTYSITIWSRNQQVDRVAPTILLLTVQPTTPVVLPPPSTVSVSGNVANGIPDDTETPPIDQINAQINYQRESKDLWRAKVELTYASTGNPVLFDTIQMQVDLKPADVSAYTSQFQSSALPELAASPGFVNYVVDPGNSSNWNEKFMEFIEQGGSPIATNDANLIYFPTSVSDVQGDTPAPYIAYDQSIFFGQSRYSKGFSFNLTRDQILKLNEQNFQLRDVILSKGLAGGGDVEVILNNATFSFTAVNNRPDSVSRVLTAESGHSLEIISSLYTRNQAGNPLDSEEDYLEFQVMSLPDASTGGSFKKNGADLSVGEFFLATDGITYEGRPNSEGQDVLTFSANDGIGSSLLDSTIIINVNSPIPTAVDDSATVNEDQALTGGPNLLTNDFDPPSGTPTRTRIEGTGPAHAAPGSFSLQDGIFTYTHDGSETTTDTFQYVAIDADGNESNVATVTITIRPGNDAPEASDVRGTATEDGAATAPIAYSITDLDGGAPSYTLTQPTEGNATDNGDGTFTFNPGTGFQDLAAGATEDATFTYTVNDGNGGTDTANITITVTGVNDLPQANDVTGSANEDGPEISINVLPNFSDVDSGNTHTFTFSNAGTIGDVTNNDDGTFTYNASGKFEGLVAGQTTTDTFTYVVTDNNGGDSESKMVTITVTGQNDTPEAIDITAAANEDGPAITVSPSYTDVDTTDTHTVTEDTTGTRGSITRNTNGTFNYDPNGLFENLAVGVTDTDTFTYTVTDSNGGQSASKTVTVTITGQNDAPEAENDNTSLTSGSSFVDIDVVINDTDIDTPNSTLRVAAGGITSGPANGTAELQPDGRTIQYAPRSGFSGNDSFTYKVNDGTVDSDVEATVTITIANRLPVAIDYPENPSSVTIDDIYKTNINTPIRVDVLNGDRMDVETSNEDLVLEVISPTDLNIRAEVEGAGLGRRVKITVLSTATIPEDQLLQVDYRITDAAGGSDTGTITIKVYRIGDFTRDGVLNTFDFRALSQRVGSSLSEDLERYDISPAPPQGPDGVINVFDMRRLSFLMSQPQP